MAEVVVAAPPIWTNEMMDHLDHHDARTGQQQRAGEAEPQQQPDKQGAEPQQDYKRLRQDAEAQEAAEAEGPDAEAEEAEPPAAEAEGADEPPRTEANHWGWKTWSDTITDGDNHTTHAAICGPDGLVWTSSATSDAWRHGRVGSGEGRADAGKGD
eukprot:COSAG04_NODE_7865_length_1054_cov_26.258639_2_plen_156_part_00